jgi:pimeloyl-ACP methyl ester carboxylesterase
MPALAREFEVIAVDQRGIGLSGMPEEGYDAGTLENDLAGLMDALGHERFAVVGVDTGLLIGYALVADYPDRVVRLAVGEAPLPGITPPNPLILPNPRRRAANPSACAEARSSHCSSSITQISGRSPATSDNRLSTARPTKNRSGGGPAARPNAVRSASRWGVGRLSALLSRGAHS